MLIERPISVLIPMSFKEDQKRAWEVFDVILISGDAYVDHPAFGTAVVSRIIEDEGLRIGIVAQPNWKDDLRDFKKLGKPKLFFGVTADCMNLLNAFVLHKFIQRNNHFLCTLISPNQQDIFSNRMAKPL